MRVRGFCRLLAAICVAGLVGARLSAAATLAGMVRDSTGGAIAGASVFILRAAPLRGLGLLCPSCYPDCAKHARTDAAGRFEILRLDDSLQFSVAAVARGHAPIVIERVVPASGPLDARLARRDLAGVADSLLVRGRVLDPAGAPIEGAIVTPIGWRRGILRAFGRMSGDPRAVTDADGRFELETGPARIPAGFPRIPALPDSAAAWMLMLEARGLAKETIANVAPGRNWNTLRMRRGAMLRGRVLEDGRPRAGVAVGAAQHSHLADTFVGWQTIATDERGYFMFSNLQAGADYDVYVLMEGFSARGGAPATRCSTAADDSMSWAGDLTPTPPHRLAGRIVLSDGSPPPTRTPVLLSRIDAVDRVTLWTDSQGRFGFAPLPAESLDVSVPLPGWRLAPSTPGVSPDDPETVRIEGRGDVELVLTLERGSP